MFKTMLMYVDFAVALLVPMLSEFSEEIAHNTTYWCLFCIEPQHVFVFAQNTIFCCNHLHRNTIFCCNHLHKTHNQSLPAIMANYSSLLTELACSECISLFKVVLKKLIYINLYNTSYLLHLLKHKNDRILNTILKLRSAA
jgi:hypothetical protein